MRTSKFAVPPRALRGSVVLICIAMALVAATSAAARTTTASSTARQADAKSWCKAVIDANTKAGTMKNKRFVSFATVPLSAYKRIVNEAVANGAKYIALAPSLDQDGSQASDRVLQEHQGPQLLEDHAARTDDAGRRQEDHGLRADPVWDQVQHVSGEPERESARRAE